MRCGLFKGAIVAASIVAFGAAVSAAQAEGAVAVGVPSDVARLGVAIGFVVNRPIGGAAGRDALDRCRKVMSAPPETRDLCREVSVFRRKCLAIAMDPAQGTPGWGYGIAGTKEDAEKDALDNCYATAGPGRYGTCKTFASNCDTRD